MPMMSSASACGWCSATVTTATRAITTTAKRRILVRRKATCGRDQWKCSSATPDGASTR
ncbi:hypothetical protein FQZ97_543610 [compost metagenome]